ncbi:hypothetical protein RRSWK_02231 [Rhodopirellula sp. SWK7]|nr:hypothetical protein RRSWK_02231 [Rhodopirellula sp. SWK7]
MGPLNVWPWKESDEGEKLTPTAFEKALGVLRMLSGVVDDERGVIHP